MFMQLFNLVFQIVFIPIWIVMCVSMIGVIYAIILAILLSRSPEIIRDQHRGNLTTAVGYSLLVIPMLVFEVSILCLVRMKVFNLANSYD